MLDLTLYRKELTFDNIAQLAKNAEVDTVNVHRVDANKSVLFDASNSCEMIALGRYLIN